MAVARRFGLVAGLIGLIASVPAAAQFGSDSFNFLKAVKDRSGDDALKYLSKPDFTGIDERDEETGETALHIVAKRRDTAWLSVLLAKGARVDLRDRNGATPLLDAATIGWPDGEQKLIDAGARVNLGNSSGETPLMRAAANRDLESVRLLLAAGADASTRDRTTGKTARDYAVVGGRGEPVIKLLDAAKPVKAVTGPHL